MKRTRLLTRLVLSTCLFHTGCATLPPDWKRHIPWSAEAKLKESQYGKPNHLVAVWTPDILVQPGKPPTRGFGGRLYFYDEKNQAIPVEGQLIVYGYDDSQPDHIEGEPDRKFAFTPEQFSSHYSPSELGASYSIWLPWDAAGGDQASISLVPVFTTTNGQVIMGEHVRNVLPGKTRALAKKETTQPKSPVTQAIANGNGSFAVQPAAAAQAVEEQQSAGSASSKPRIRTSTIQIPRSMQLRLQQARDGVMTTPSLAQPTGADLQADWNAVQSSTQTITGPELPSVGATANLHPLSAQARARIQPGVELPPSRFERPRSPAPAGPVVQSGPAAGAMPQLPATPPSSLGPSSGLN